MCESTYSLASFIQKETDNKPITGVEARRISAFVNNPTSSLCDANYFVYDIIDEEELQLKRKSFPKSLGELFAFVKYPYTVNPPTMEYNAQYVVENENIRENIRAYNGKDRIYNNGRERIWNLEEV
jgi:hypothetical protein